jgi:hypothetical protein
MNDRHRHIHRGLIDWLVIGVYQLDQDLVLSGREILDDYRHAARVRPVPGRVIDGYMDVADAGRY